MRAGRRASRGRSWSFRAPLGRITQNRCVDVPDRVSAALGRARVPVRAAVLGTRFESTLVPRGAGRHRLFIPSQVWRAHGLEIGDVIPVEITKAPARRDEVVPAELLEAAAGDPLVAGEYVRLSPADKRQIARRVAGARSRQARQRMLARIAAILASRAVRRAI